MTDSQPWAAARRAMITNQLRARGIVDRAVLEAMARVPRERFVPEELQREAYDDRALPIDCGQTISQPYMVAVMTEALQLRGGERVLDIGTGSGYQAAVLAELVARVVSIERHGRLAETAAARLAELGYRNVRVVHGDGSLGCEEEAPFEGILIAAAALEVPPPLFAQLAEGGRLVAPVGGTEEQMLQVFRKRGGRIEVESRFPCRFVPLLPGDSPE